MEHIYKRFLDVYRFGIIIFLANEFIKQVDMAEIKNLSMLMGMIVYVVVFALFNHQKLASYFEWAVVLMCVLVMTEVIGNLVYLLIAIPAIKIVSNRVSYVENIFISASLGVFVYLSGFSLLLSALMAFSFFIFVLALSVNYRKIGLLEEEVGKVKEDNVKLEYEASKKNNQVEMISKLFYRKKRMEDISDTKGIIEEIVVTAYELYHSDYSALYQFKNGNYEMVFVKGETTDVDIPKKIQLQKASQMSIKKEQMTIPIEYEKRAWGLLVVHGKKSEITEEGRKVRMGFEESDLEIIYMYLETALARLKEVKLTNKLTEAAFYDRLTAIPNRAHLEKQLLQEQIDKMKKEKRIFAVMMIDIDSFKSFNDTFGHAVGDDVLRSVARIAKGSLTDKADVFGRWGGEEFVAYLGGTPKEIQAKAERIRKNIEQFDFPKRKITISAGIAFYGKEGKTLDEVMEKADQALYYSKEKGKNRITFYHTMNKN